MIVRLPSDTWKQNDNPLRTAAYPWGIQHAMPEDRKRIYQENQDTRDIITLLRSCAATATPAIYEQRIQGWTDRSGTSVWKLPEMIDLNRHATAQKKRAKQLP